MSFPVALQLYSVRDEFKANMSETLKKVKEMGYDGVEFAGLNATPYRIDLLCKEHGLIPISAHVPFVDMMKDIAGEFYKYNTIGCKYIAVPFLAGIHRPGHPNFNYVMENIATIGRAAKDFGMQLLYHNHEFEFMKLDGKYALDLLYETVPADRLQTELDVCWVKVGGEDPAEYIRKYAGRAPIVHLKDFVGSVDGAAYELIGSTEGKAPERPSDFEFRPVGSGCQDIPAIIEAAKDAGTEWLVVEQDNPSMGLTPLECAQKSIEYLRSIGV